jgi:hypothetical protein
MAAAVIRPKEMKKQSNASCKAPPLHRTSERQNQAHLIVLVEATREREQAALMISELGRQAVERLLHLAERAAYF